MTELTINFSLKELTKSNTAERLGIDNTPNEATTENLKTLCENVLQPIRNHFGRVSVSSGFRSLELNRALRSSDTSQHISGQAADIECPNVDNLRLAHYIDEHIQFDQLILEFYNEGDPSSGWVHVSFNSDGSNRKRVMSAVKRDGKTVYLSGLPV